MFSTKISLPSSAWVHIVVYLPPTSFQMWNYNSQSLISDFYMCKGLDLSTGAWATYSSHFPEATRLLFPFPVATVIDSPRVGARIWSPFQLHCGISKWLHLVQVAIAAVSASMQLPRHPQGAPFHSTSSHPLTLTLFLSIALQSSLSRGRSRR